MCVVCCLLIGEIKICIMEIEEEDFEQNSQSWWSRWIPWQRGHGMDPRSRSPAKDTAGPGVEADTTGMGRSWWPSRGNEAVGPMPDTYGYRHTRLSGAMEA